MLTNSIKRFPLPLFFLLCLVISWAIWIPQAITKINNPDTPIGGGSPVNMLAVWAPALSAILLAVVINGKAGLRALLQPLKFWRVGARWYLFILLYPAVIWLVARPIDALFGHPFEHTIPILSYFPPDQAYMIVAALIFTLPNTLGEELGWRGFALPGLQVKHSALMASIMLGLFWGIWHIPLWIANGMVGMELIRSLINITTYAFIFTWVYNNTEGSLLLAWLFHASTTITQYFLQTPLTLTDDFLRLVVAILIVIFAGSINFSRKHERSKINI